MAGTKGTVATFPLSSKVGSGDGSYTELQKQLGNEVEGSQGKMYRLVQATDADGTTGRSQAYKYTSKSAFTVESGDAAGNPTCCGFGLAAQDSLAVGDLFWIQIAGLTSVTATGTQLADSVLVEASSGDVVLDAAPLPGTTLGLTTAIIAADAVGTIQLFGRLS